MLFTLLCAAVVFAATPAPDPATPPNPGTRAMAQRLALLDEAANPWANPYLNERRAALFRSLPLPPGARDGIALEFQLARELLLAGESEEALQRLRALGPVAQQPRVRRLIGTALLRLGEQRNCLQHHTSESCLMPIRGAGVHRDKEPARQAILEYLAILETEPDDLESRWLLNVAAMAAGDYPQVVPPAWRLPAASLESEFDIGRFTDIATEVGVARLSLAGGTLVEDFDGDADLDIMVSSSGMLDPLSLYLNNGDGTFAETDTGVPGVGGGLNLVHADYDNDGDADVLVLRGAWLGIPPARDGGRYPNSLLRNRGDGTFDDVTEAAGLLDYLPSQTAAFADYDNDGWLDLFVGNESYSADINPSRLFRNNGDGTFRDVGQLAALRPVGLIKGVSWGDYDNDGWVDLYVSRLGSPNLLFHNEGPDEDGQVRFSEGAVTAGVDRPLRSFPTWFWDYDNDGWLDLFVAGYGTGRGSQGADVMAELLELSTDAARPRLYRNLGDGTFEDATARVGLNRIAFAMGANYGDLDNDGWLDLYLGTGDPDLKALVPNRMFRSAAGQSFQDVTTSGGFGHLQKGHGIAFADLDNDGDQDVYAGLGGFFSGDVYPNALFENPGHGNRWLKLELRGVRANRAAIGARVEIVVEVDGARRTLHRLIGSGGSFGGAPMRCEIGLGGATRIVSVTVAWPGGARSQRFTGLALDGAYRLTEGQDRAARLELKPLNFKRRP